MYPLCFTKNIKENEGKKGLYKENFFAKILVYSSVAPKRVKHAR